MAVHSLDALINIELLAEALTLLASVPVHLLCLSFFHHHPSRLSRDLRTLFVLTNVHGLLYVLCRGLLILQEKWSMLPPPAEEAVGYVRVYTLMWALYWLAFVSMERFVSTVLVDSKGGFRPGLWRFGLFTVSLLTCNVSSVINSVAKILKWSTVMVVLPITIVILSLAILISQNIKIMMRLQKAYVTITVHLFVVNLLIVGSYSCFQKTTKPFLVCYELYLISLAALFLLLAWTILNYNDHFRRLWAKRGRHPTNSMVLFIKPSTENIVNVFNQKIIIDNTPENNFNALQQIWMEQKHRRT